MVHEREVSLSLPVLPGAAETRCVDHLRAVLQAEPGIRGLEFDMRAGRLRLRFDPRQVSLTRIQQVARHLGLELERRFANCSMRLHGIRCTDCTLGLEHHLAGLTGVARVVVNPASGAIAVEYDPSEVTLQAFEEVIRRAGYPVESRPRTREALQAAHRQEAAIHRRMAILTALCLAGWLLGWLGGSLLGWPQTLVLAIYAVAYVAGGYHSSSRALRELASGSVSVDLLMVLAAFGAAAVGEWPEGAFLLFLFSLSNTLEQFVLGRTRRAIEALMDLSPQEAIVRRDGQELELPVHELRLDDLLIVRPGERIGADGVIQVGHTSIDQSAMTGESIPVEKKIGDRVFAGTLNQQGAIEVRVTHLAGETTLARIVQLVEEAQSEKAQSQRFTDWFGSRYTLGVLTAAGLTLLVPLLLLGEPFEKSFYRAMTLLVVASPCAVVISIPAAILTAITSAARGGVLFKGGAHLERAATVRAIAFDKTGTLTVGRPRLVELCAIEGLAPEAVLCLAAAAEGLSEHPLATAVTAGARERSLDLPPATDLEAVVGRGVRARVEGRWIRVGKACLMPDEGRAIPSSLAETASRWSSAGRTVLFVGDDQGVLGLLAVADTLRPGAEDAIRQLRELGVERMVMLTGDNAVVARAIAERLGMSFEAELLPENKLEVIRRLRVSHDVVAMVGDGINDAPSLAAATLGVSLGGSGTDVALETADVVLMADDLRKLPYAIGLARQANAIIRQNLLFAFAMMALLIASTFLGVLRLPFAVVGHEGSTALVILNGLRLLAFPRNQGPVVSGQ